MAERGGQSEQWESIGRETLCQRCVFFDEFLHARELTRGGGFVQRQDRAARNQQIANLFSSGVTSGQNGALPLFVPGAEQTGIRVDDKDFRVQAAAIEALAIIGDPAAIPALQRMIDRELDGRLRRRGKEVVRDLGEGAPLGEDVRRLRDEVGELRGIVTALRERLDNLEPARKPAPAKPAPRKRKR